MSSWGWRDLHPPLLLPKAGDYRRDGSGDGWLLDALSGIRNGFWDSTPSTKALLSAP